MDNLTFGQYLKQVRKKSGISTRELSKKVEKGESYVSQIERGLIKNPDYNTAYKLLKLLDVDEKVTESMLNYFGIKSHEQEQAEIEWILQEAEKIESFDWYDNEKTRVKSLNKNLYSSLELLIDRNLDTAEKIISNIEKLTWNKECFNFLFHLHKYDYSSLSSLDRKELIGIIKNFIEARYYYDEWNDLVRKDDK